MPFKKKEEVAADELTSVSEETGIAEVAPKKKKGFKPEVKRDTIFRSVAFRSASSMYYISPVDTIIEEVDGVPTVRKIRYVEGESSIYADKQSKDAKPTPILMKGGVIIIPATKPNLVEFLRKSNILKDNPNRDKAVEAEIYEENKEREAENALQLMEVEDKAIALFAQFSFEDYQTVARNVPHLRNRVSTMGSTELKFEVRNFVKGNPKAFLDICKDPRKDIVATLVEAEEFSIISKRGNRVLYGDKSVLELPVTVGDYIEFMADWIIGGEGKVEYAEIKKSVDRVVK